MRIVKLQQFYDQSRIVCSCCWWPYCKRQQKIPMH